MSDYFLKYTGQKIDELIEAVDQKTIYDDATRTVHGLMSAEDKEKLDSIDEVIGKMLQFKGFVSQTAPTGTIKGGSLWYVADSMPVSFPVNVKTYDATTGVWSSTTSVYNPEALDLWSNMNDDKEYYWFGNGWNMIDDNGRFIYVSTFEGVVGNPQTLYYLDTAYSTYEKGFYRFIPASGGNPAKFILLNKELFKYVSTFTGVTGDVDRLYFLDTEYDSYKVGFYRFIEAQGSEPAKFVRINPSPVEYVSTFTGVTGNTEHLYHLDTEYDNYEVGFYRYVEATETEPEKFVILNKDRFKYVSTFTGEIGDINRLYYLDTTYDTFKKGFYRYNGTTFVNINSKQFFIVQTFTGVEGDDEALYYLDTAYDTYKVGFYRFIPAAGAEPARFLLIGAASEVFIDVEELPTTDINANTIYRKATYEYSHNGEELESEPVGYKIADTENITVSAAGITIDGTETLWEDLTDTIVSGLVTAERLTDADFTEADFFNYYTTLFDIASNFERETTYTLYYNPTATADKYIQIGGDDVVIDNETIVENSSNELQANAIIDVDVFPTREDIKENTFYRKRNEHFYDVNDNEVIADTKYICDGEHVEAQAMGLIDKSTLVPTPWSAVTDAIVENYITSGYITVTETIGDTPYSLYFIKTGENSYSHLMCISNKVLYHYEDGAWKLVSEDAAPDNTTIEVVSDKLQANAIIDVDTLPTTDIKEKSLYRKEIQHFYNVEGEEMTPINIYNAVEGMGVLIGPGGIQIGEDTTPWSSITDTWVSEHITNGYFVESDKAINNGDSFIKLAADSYAFINRLVNTKVLYYRDNNTWKEVGSGGGNSDVDEVTTEIVNDKLQANAIVRINTLPTDNIKPNSFYSITETVSYELEEWTYNGSKIDVTPTCYESLSQEVEVTVGGITYNEVIPWNEVTQELVDELVSNNLVGECEFPKSSFCGFNGQFDHESKFTHTIEQKSFSMVKTFKWDVNSWTSIATIALTNEEYNQLSEEQKMDGTIYIIDDLTPVVVENSYNTLADKPAINGIILQGSLSLEDLGLYSRSEVNALLENKGQVEFVDALPATPTTNTWYYSKKYEDGTDVPDDKRCLYIVDEDITVFHEMGVVGDIEMETGDTLSGSEHLVTSSQVVKKEMSTKLNKYGTQVNIESAVDDATLWTSLAQIGTDDKNTDSSMVFNAGTCYLTSSVSPTKTAQIFQFIVTGSVGASAINKRITLINPLTNEMFTKVMDGGTWQAWKGGKKYKHTLVRYNNDAFEYPMGWVSIISNKKTMSVNDFKTWLNEKGYTTATNSYYWCGGCCGTTEVRNGAGTGKAYVGKVVSGVYYDGTNLFFKWDYNGTTQINPARCKIVTEELN